MVVHMFLFEALFAALELAFASSDCRPQEFKALGTTVRDRTVVDILASSTLGFTPFVINFGAGCYTNTVEECVRLDVGLQSVSHYRWPSLNVEPDKWGAVLLRNLLNATPAHVVQDFITPLSVESILARYNVPREPAVLKIDIDGYDCPMLDSLLALGYRPLLVFLEVNPEIPPPIAFSILYSPLFHFNWGEAGFFGCSLSYAGKLLRSRGYRLLQYRMDKSHHDSIWVHEQAWHLYKFRFNSEWEAFAYGWSENKGMVPHLFDSQHMDCFHFNGPQGGTKGALTTCAAMWRAASQALHQCNYPGLVDMVHSTLRRDMFLRSLSHNDGHTSPFYLRVQI